MSNEKKKKRLSPRKKKDTLTAYAFISPWIIGFACFTLFPIFFMLQVSLTNRKLNGISKFIGFKNYMNMFKSPAF